MLAGAVLNHSTTASLPENPRDFRQVPQLVGDIVLAEVELPGGIRHLGNVIQQLLAQRRPGPRPAA